MQIKENPKVSVFMAVYQQKDFIRESLDSVLMQNYPNMEIIIGDDGSTDGTQEILKDYQAWYPQTIKLIPSPSNTGITANSNRIFRECCGKYIAFQAGDDIWLPGKITEQVSYMEQHPECSICYHNLDVFDSVSGKSSGNFNNSSNIPRQGGVEVSIRYGCFNGAVSNMVRREQAPSHGFDTRIPVASDWLFWVETLLGGGEIHYINQIFGRYRIHENSSSSIASRKIINNLIDHLNSCMIILANHPRYVDDVFFQQSRIFEILGTVDHTNRQLYRSISAKVGGGWMNRIMESVRRFL